MRTAMLVGWAVLAAMAYGVGAAGAQAAPARPQASSAKGVSDKPKGQAYLGEARIPDSVAILPPPPPKGSMTAQRDTAVYKATRALMGTPRGDLSATDSYRYIQAYDCALGYELEKGPAEVLTLLGRVGRDASLITNRAKDHYKIPRPFVGNTDTICTEKDRSGLTGSPSYPSGHATYSWAVGLILAELAPEHATAVLARARAFGESRVVCGVHTVSDIEEGRTNGSILVAALHGDREFRDDMDAARAALRAAMLKPHAVPDAGQCKVENDAAAHTPWVNPTTDK